MGPLLRLGFRPVTRLFYYEHLLNMAFPLQAANLLKLITYTGHNKDLFHATLLRTYEASLDCPELNGVRTIEEIIAGHMAQGNYRPERWWLALAQNRPVAVALVTEVADLGAWDLSYLGVVPGDSAAAATSAGRWRSMFSILPKMPARSESDFGCR